MRKMFLLLAAPLLLANQGGCDGSPQKVSAQAMEQHSQNLQMEQFLRNQPVPSIDFSLERHILIQLYVARQKATNTFSVVQSAYTGKVLWSCPSIGFPIPYATQLTNPNQVQWKGGMHEYASAVLAQQEPNGLFSPASADGTWVPCVDERGKITPVYEEKKVTVFLRPMEEKDGKLVPVPNTAPSLSINIKGQN